MIATVTRLLAPLRTRIANLVSRAVVELIKDSTGLQVMQVSALDGETREALERFQQYGFTSVPLGGAEAVVLFVGGRRDHGLVLSVDDRRYRKKSLEAGEVAIYTDEGDYLLMSRGRIVEIQAGTKVRINAPIVEITGDLNVSGTVSDMNGSMAEMRTKYNSHNHPTAPDGPVSPPSVPMD